MVSSLKSLVEAPTVQGCPLLQKLPIELRYMIYDHIFTDRAEMRLPHPLMLVCKEIQAEAIEAATRIIGPKIELCMGFNTKSVVYQLQYRFDEHEPLRYFQCARASGSAGWWGYNAFGRYIFGPQFLRRMRTIWIHWQFTNTLFVVLFRPGALSPEVVLRTTARLVDTRTRVNADDAFEVFLALAEEWRSNRSGCSLEWVESCIKDLRKGWEGLRKEARERMLRG